jgi:hypothetical protein
MMWMNSNSTSEATPRPCSTGARRARDRRRMAAPKISAMTSTCSHSPRAKAPMKLSVKMLRMKSAAFVRAPLVTAEPAATAGSGVFRPTPST